MPEDPQKRPLVVPLDAQKTDGIPFFMVPGLGGHVMSAQVLTRHVPEPWRGFGILYPAFSDSEPRLTSFAAMAERLVPDILEHQANGPFLFMGYSMGGFVCVELARALRARGHRAGIVMVDVKLVWHAPLLPVFKRLPLKAYWMLREQAVKVFDRSKTRARELEKRRLSRVEEQGIAGGGNPSFRRAVVDGRTALAAYELTPFNVPIALIRCAEMAWWDSLRQWPHDYGWSQYTRVLDVSTSPGDHLQMISGPRLQPLGEAMARALGLVSDAVQALPPSIRAGQPAAPVRDP
jgi:thioesterase domain-containing protein